MPIKLLTSPDGEELVQMVRSEYEDLVDARDHALAMRDIAGGNMPVISDEDMDAYLEAPTPLAFWRKQRGMTQTELAKAIEMSQPYVTQIESGRKMPSMPVFQRLARILGVRIDDLVVD